MSRKNKVFRAFLHQNPSPTIEETWDAAWANQQDCFQSKRMRELEGTIGLERIDAHKLRERIALLEAVAEAAAHYRGWFHENEKYKQAERELDGALRAAGYLKEQGG